MILFKKIYIFQKITKEGLFLKSLLHFCAITGLEVKNMTIIDYLNLFDVR